MDTMKDEGPIAGFKRKIELGDPFAPSLFDLAQSHLREIRDSAQNPVKFW